MLRFATQVTLPGARIYACAPLSEKPRAEKHKVQLPGACSTSRRSLSSLIGSSHQPLALLQNLHWRHSDSQEPGAVWSRNGPWLHASLRKSQPLTVECLSRVVPSTDGHSTDYSAAGRLEPLWKPRLAQTGISQWSPSEVVIAQPSHASLSHCPLKREVRVSAVLLPT